MNKPPAIRQLEMTEADIEFAERIAKRLGYTQTAYTSSSELWGLYCLPDHSRHKHGCIIKTAQFGFLFVADLEDLQLHDLFSDELKAAGVPEHKTQAPPSCPLCRGERELNGSGGFICHFCNTELSV